MKSSYKQTNTNAESIRHTVFIVCPPSWRLAHCDNETLFVFRHNTLSIRQRGYTQGKLLMLSRLYHQPPSQDTITKWEGLVRSWWAPVDVHRWAVITISCQCIVSCHLMIKLGAWQTSSSTLHIPMPSQRLFSIIIYPLHVCVHFLSKQHLPCDANY